METTNTRTRREAAVLVFVVFLLGLLVGGVGNHFWGQSVWGSRQSRPHMGPPSRAKVIDDFTRELQLTPDQQKQLGTIIDQTRADWAAQHEATHQRDEAIRQQAHARMRAILTPEQVPKFDAFMQRLNEQRKKDQPPQGPSQH